MQVRVLFFGMIKDVVGRDSELLRLPEEAQLADVLDHYEESAPRLQELLSSIAMSVNQEYAKPDQKLKDGDEIGLLPPVSGGARSKNHISIVREKINVEATVAMLKCPQDGAVVVFEGTVRDNTRGRRTLYLDYEAYEEMALKEMELLAGEAPSRFAIRELALVHRLGRLEIGETSVLIVVASAHRGPAFEACRWLIDTLKRKVPIWKKEHFEDGAVWADGEPFPEEIPRPQGISGGDLASN